MEVNNQINLKFHGVDFPIINLHSTEPLVNKNDKSININILPKVYYSKDKNNFFKIIQEIRLNSEDKFDLFILAVGNFELEESIDENLKKKFVNINAPAIMFPYVRSFIATLTANLGNVIGVLNIPTQFFKGDIEVIDKFND
jgi:preprotein translocase subunit SecB